MCRLSKVNILVTNIRLPFPTSSGARCLLKLSTSKWRIVSRTACCQIMKKIGSRRLLTEMPVCTLLWDKKTGNSIGIKWTNIFVDWRQNLVLLQLYFRSVWIINMYSQNLSNSVYYYDLSVHIQVCLASCCFYIRTCFAFISAYLAPWGFCRYLDSRHKTVKKRKRKYMKKQSEFGYTSKRADKVIKEI